MALLLDHAVLRRVRVLTVWVEPIGGSDRFSIFLEAANATPSEKQRQVSIGFTAFLRTGRTFIALWSCQMEPCRAKTT
jgi:hypothetical protein